LLDSRIPFGGGWRIEGPDTIDHHGGRQRRFGFFAAHSITLRRVMTDTALNYRRSRDFQAALAVLGARHVLTRPHCPWQNGKSEHVNRTPC